MDQVSSDAAYRELRERILGGDLAAGVALKERDLCAELGISRTPVREALRRLNADGLVEMQPRRSIRVSTFDEEELAEIYEIGNLLQSHITGRAAKKATDVDLERLHQLIVEMEELVADSGHGKVKSFAKLDHAFHSAISDIACNSRIAQIIDQTISIRLLTNVMDEYSDADFAKSISEHKEILAALEAGNAHAAFEAMSAHAKPRMS